MPGRRLRRTRRTFRPAQQALGRFQGQPKLAAKITVSPTSDIGVERRLRAIYPRRELGSASEGVFRFVGGEAFAPQDGLAVVGLQFQPLAGRGGRASFARWRSC